MKITLQVDGRELSWEEVETIVREHFSRKEATKQKSTKQEKAKPIPRPTEGIPFEVNPLEIDRQLFLEEREDEDQEETRQHILEAFVKMDENPERYGKPFKTLMPKKTWVWKTVDDHRELATKLGDHMANWVEQFLEWAQRIQNGESWEDICNEVDTANWYRLIEWKNGCARFVGGSKMNISVEPASCVYNHDCNSRDEVRETVPLVVLYK